MLKRLQEALRDADERDMVYECVDTLRDVLPALIECAEMLSKLKAWEQYMGGYASTVWREAEAALAKLEQTK